MGSIRFLFLICTLTSTGCAQVQLQKNAVRKAESLDGIYQQQVLDNLAKFLCDPNSLPHFAIPTQGTSAVNDSFGADGRINFNASRFVGAFLNSGGSRELQENWVLTPISDPRKLERMRCAYQLVVANCGFCQPDYCPDCNQVLNKFYTGSATDESWVHDFSRVSTSCLTACEPWFGAGPKCDVPKDCSCLLIGKYCDYYVWVYPKYHDQLAKLTLCMLDFSLNDAKEVGVPLKKVTLYLNSKGKPVPEEKATQIVETEVELKVNDISNLIVAHEIDNEKSKQTNLNEVIPLKSFESQRSPTLLESSNLLRSVEP